ncbi:NlpC/P60 family protein [Albimonas donghaensis]|uniref:NlpC/P60 family protein n=1 Tax=Albimonas donghaensis TaxID=356660 RepID=A0A1H3FHU1_9RHOB|nr:NlpC/P60 family protein [Albimonas donghaensis]SDX90546.1 NlpC/P60 family protein [Albimonas donghaensis]
MIWADSYVGLPWADLGRNRSGCDCYGLARMVYAEQLGIALPSYAGAYPCAGEQAEVAALIGRESELGPWRPVADVVAPFDLLLFRRGRLASHLGVALGDGRMLHMDGEAQARVARLDDPRWRMRFVGAFRHAEAGARIA